MIGILLIAALVVSVLDHIYYVKYINSRLRRIDYRLPSKPKRYLDEDIDHGGCESDEGDRSEST